VDALFELGNRDAHLDKIARSVVGVEAPVIVIVGPGRSGTCVAARASERRLKYFSKGSNAFLESTGLEGKQVLIGTFHR
jgi:hypothetical protein